MRVVKTKQNAVKRKDAKLNQTDVDVLQDLETADLKLMCQALGLSKKGSKAEIKKRVEDVLWD